MNSKGRKLAVVCSFSILLMSFQCDKEDIANLIYPKTKITISEGAVFTTKDTLWIKGVATTMLYDVDTQDSIPNTNESLQEVISILRLRPAERTSNSTDAVKDFELVARIGTIDFLGACPEADIIPNGPRTANGTSYRYEIGLVPKSSGDFTLNWNTGAVFNNRSINLEILEKYPINGDNKKLGLTKCGITSTLLEVDNSKSAYFFRVE